MMARAKRIYILIIKVNKLFFFFVVLFSKEIENMLSVFLSSLKHLLKLTLWALSGHIRPVNGRAICTTCDVISLSDAKNLW